MFTEYERRIAEVPPPATTERPMCGSVMFVMCSHSAGDAKPSTTKTGGSSRSTCTVYSAGRGGGGRAPAEQSTPPLLLRYACQPPAAVAPSCADAL